MDARGDARKVVIDKGVNKEALLHNVKFLEVDLGDVDCVVISHDYGDHTAATVEVVEAAGGVKVHGHPPTFLPRFYVDKEGKRHWGGLLEGEGMGASEIEAAGRGLVLSMEPVEVLPGVWTTGQVDRVTTFERILRPLARGRRS